MRKLITLLFVVVCGVQYAGAQSLHVDSTMFITGNNCCTLIKYAIPTADKGILFTGRDAGNPKGIIPFFPLDTVLNNVLIGKIDSNRQLSWIKVFGGNSDDGAGKVVQTEDDGFLVLGGTTSYNGDVTGYKGGGGDIWLLKIDKAGNLVWEKTYGSTKQDGAISFCKTIDGGCLIFGASNGGNNDVPFHYGTVWSFDWLLLKIDSNGILQWAKDIGGTEQEQFEGTVFSIDSNYYLISASDSRDHDCTDTFWHPSLYTYDDIHVLKLDYYGNVLWDSSYGGSGEEQANSAIYDPKDSTFVIVGYTTSNDFMVTGNHGAADMWVIKVNRNGKLVWQKTIGTGNDDEGHSICLANDGGYIVYGSTRYSIGAGDAWILHLDSMGNTLAGKIFGGTNEEIPFSVSPYLGGYIATGVSESIVFTEGTTYGRNNNGQNGYISYIDTGMSRDFILDQQIKKGVHVYPNPGKTLITISIPENEPGNVCIYNSMGQMVYSGRTKPKQQFAVTIADWAAGVYFLKWNSDNGATNTSKFIKE